MPSELNAVCTIITPNYLPYAAALYESVKMNLRSGANMFIFIAVTKSSLDVSLPNLPHVKYFFIEDLCEKGAGRRLKEKYLKRDLSAFRWSMKPVLMLHLIEDLAYKKVIFLDGDLFFYSDLQFLIDKLDRATVLLTPHWRSSDPFVDPANFQELLNKGLYNAGFIAVNSDALPILTWWTRLCEYNCRFEPEKGFYADQGYLNLFPIYFENVEILRHRGCNVSNWNRVECKRVAREDGNVYINDEFPIVFIHFTANTIRAILHGKDPYLLSYLEKYAGTLRKYDSKLDIISLYQNNSGKKKSILISIKRFLKTAMKGQLLMKTENSDD